MFRFKFRQNPIRWIWNYLIFQNLPLMMQVKVANRHMKFILFKRNFLDKYLGELRYVVTIDHTGWLAYASEYDSYMFRDITYRVKREKLPWFSTRPIKGTQCRDNKAKPIRLVDHTELMRNLDVLAKMVKDHNERRIQKESFFRSPDGPSGT